MIRLGVDVGGTFTDLILVDDSTGHSWVNKVPSTPADPSEAVVLGVLEICDMAGIKPGEIQQFFHGTTVATNLVLEHKGAKVGMITTEGFRDILHIARHKRPYNFSLYQDLPWQSYPLVRRRHRLTVSERIAADGSILQPLDEDKVRAHIRTLKKENVEAIAVCFLFSFMNPAHEKRVKEIILEEYPEVFMSISHEVLPQYREYERFSTVALNAYIGPKTSRYIRNLQSTLKDIGVKAELHLMQSNGGIATADTAAERPVNLLLSGPVAGLIGGIKAAKNAGFQNVITLDIGGTSADIGVAPGGTMRMRHLLDTRIGQYNAMIPMVDIDTIGAGGGSIAYVDEGGIYRVGPQSAGAIPGPACYNRGGQLPTSTDANVLLGRLKSNSMLGGRMELKPELAERAYAIHIGRKLGISALEAAAGALKIMTHNMVNAIEMNSVRKGYDPRDFVLVATGGAGPLFACDIAEELDIPFVVVPPYPGITAAAGLLATDIVYEKVFTLWENLRTPDLGRIGTVFADLEMEAVRSLKEDGMNDDQIVLKRVCDCRYAGQGYELRVDAANGVIDQTWIETLIQRFHEVHEREYSSRFEDQDVMIINARVIGVGLINSSAESHVDQMRQVEIGTSAQQSSRPVYFWVNDNLEVLDTVFLDRNELKVGQEVHGPAVIQQKDSTTLLVPNTTATVDEHLNIVIDMRAKIAEKQRRMALVNREVR